MKVFAWIVKCIYHKKLQLSFLIPWQRVVCTRGEVTWQFTILSSWKQNWLMRIISGWECDVDVSVVCAVWMRWPVCGTAALWVSWASMGIPWRWSHATDRCSSAAARHTFSCSTWSASPWVSHRQHPSSLVCSDKTSHGCDASRRAKLTNNSSYALLQ